MAIQIEYTDDLNANVESETSEAWPIWNLLPDTVSIQVAPITDDFSTAVFEVVTAVRPDAPFVSLQPALTLTSASRIAVLTESDSVYGAWIAIKVTTAEGSAKSVRVHVSGVRRD